MFATTCINSYHVNFVIYIYFYVCKYIFTFPIIKSSGQGLPVGLVSDGIYIARVSITGYPSPPPPSAELHLMWEDPAVISYTGDHVSIYTAGKPKQPRTHLTEFLGFQSLMPQKIQWDPYKCYLSFQYHGPPKLENMFSMGLGPLKFHMVGEGPGLLTKYVYQ